MDHASFLWLQQPFYLTALTVLCAYMLVAELPLIALKFKHFGWQGNAFRYLLVIGSVALLALFQLKGLPMAILLYILLSIVDNIFSKKAV
jgi:CDP-diacylglycerol--serine O-phosphatidyltransferase